MFTAETRRAQRKSQMGHASSYMLGQTRGRFPDLEIFAAASASLR